MSNMQLGLELMIIGMGTVIISLYLLAVFLYISGRVFGPQAYSKKEKNLKKGLKKEKIAALTAVLNEEVLNLDNYKIIITKE